MTNNLALQVFHMSAYIANLLIESVHLFSLEVTLMGKETDKHL